MVNQFKGAIFDLDGVITRTAKVHFIAWKKTFDGFMKKWCKENGTRFVPFTLKNDYIPFVDGKSRYIGVRDFLAARSIELPWGKIDDSPDALSMFGLGNKKNVLFKHIIETQGVEIFESTVRLIQQLKKIGIKLAVASSSNNCRRILERANLTKYFSAVVDGIDSRNMKLRGKPHPDIFLKAASEIGLSHNDCFMVEDAVSGVQAGCIGNFPLVIGVARNTDKTILLKNGADIAVDDLSEISVDDIYQWFKTGIKTDGWKLHYHGFTPDQERLRETLTTIGNGYFGTRGCYEGEKDRDDIHYPGTYIAGVYNKMPTRLSDATVYNNDLVNCPNWLPVEFELENGEILRPLDREMADYYQCLDMKNAEMRRVISFKDKKGRIVSVDSTRFASMADPHYAAIRCSISSDDYSGKLIIRTALDGTITNNGVPRYRSLTSQHLEPVNSYVENDELHLAVKTISSNITIYVRSKSAVYTDGKRTVPQRQFKIDKGFVGEEYAVRIKKGASIAIEKIVSLFTSKDRDVKDVATHANKSLARATTYHDLFRRHTRAWSKLWDASDITIHGDRFSQRASRLHIYHLYCSASRHNTAIDAGMPARGLHGEAYRGHIFWDELFIFPFYNITLPEITRALLMYRYRRLPMAKKNAEKLGCRGALYPWQSADDGGEETQEQHYNPLSGEWGPDLSRRQRHVSIAIAYNFYSYFTITNDYRFFYKYGAEILVEIVRFWVSICTYDQTTRRYSITGVMGPDEFHEKYTWSEKPGLKDNSYTNIMVAWLMKKTLETIRIMPGSIYKKFTARMNISKTEMATWNKISSKMNVCFSDSGILMQFDGYDKLKDIDWKYYKEKYTDIHRMDRILKSEGDTPDQYKVAKQADVLMLFYLLSPAQVKEMLGLMEYSIGDENEFMKKNYQYYVYRTSHGSTLSYVVHSALYKYGNIEPTDRWTWFLNALKSDIYDTQGGTTTEGIHCGVMAGTIDIIIKSFAGINFSGDGIEINPRLPKHWQTLQFNVLYRGSSIHFKITQTMLRMKLNADSPRGIVFVVNKKRHILRNRNVLLINYRNQR